MKISIIGQGYVGLPLAMAAVDSGFTVFGIDVNEQKIDKLRAGISTVEDISDELIRSSVDSQRYVPTTDQVHIEESKVVLICVPTPLGDDNRPDLSALLNAVSTVGKNLKEGSLVIVESTIEPGTCRTILLPILKKMSGLNEDKFYFAYSPERIDPLNKSWTISNTPKLVAGLTEAAAAKAEVFYGKFINSITKCSSLEIAETAKLLENSFRLINISFINELAMFCQKIGINILEVITAAATKPYGFMPFYPSIGVGGHCIPVDPLYLANAARNVGVSTRFIDLADQVNREMPEHFIGRAEDKIGGLKNKKVLVVGVSYKPNVADVRESPVAALISGLRQRGALVDWHDDLVKEWNGEKSVEISSNFDLAIIAMSHDYLDLKKLGDTIILDTRGSV
jgi:UDP-N-acetyl-D-glucosamine dehydrogenase